MIHDVVVLKFGGTALRSTARLRRAAARIRYHIEQGSRPVAVVSARGRSTDGLVRAAERLGVHDTCGRELDRLLATAEDRSAALLAIACSKLGIPARSLRGGEAGIQADGDHAEGQIEAVETSSIRSLLDEEIVPIVSGFQGVRRDGETITLGRGGSDTTAIAIAEALDAAPCHIVTDVPAVYDRDPAAHPDASPLDVLDHATLVALAESGARVLHPEAARLAMRHSIPLRIYDYRAPIRGRIGGTRVDAIGCVNKTVTA